MPYPASPISTPHSLPPLSLREDLRKWYSPTVRETEQDGPSKTSVLPAGREAESSPWKLRRLACVATLLLLAFWGWPLEVAAQINHVGLAPVDRFLACAESTLKKHVLAYHAEGHPAEAVACPAPSGEALVRALKAAGYSTLMNKNWALVVSSDLLFREKPADPFAHIPAGFWMPWKDISVEVTTENASSGSDAAFSTSQLASLQVQLLQEARLLPVEDSTGAGVVSTEEVPDVPLRYDVYRVHLSDTGPESVVAVLHQNKYTDLGRVIYGVMEEENVKLLWDSPVVEVRTDSGVPDIQFRDVDGDGVKEILVRAEYPAGRTREGRVIWTMLTIFNRDGEEVSRQDCKFPSDFNAYGDAACAIAGEGLRLNCDSFPCSISLARDPSLEYEDAGSSFKLENGRYRRVLTAAALNEEGMRLMRGKNYDGAKAKFMDAYHLHPTGASAAALYANNAGFAWYKLGRYEESIEWIQTSIKLDSKRAVAYLNLGDALVKLNRKAEARRAYTKYLELAPNSKSASEVNKKLEALRPFP